MKVLGISASPRSGGNTDRMLDSVLEGALSSGASVEKICLRDLRIRHISEDDYRAPDPAGILSADDDMAKVFSGIAKADAVIFASPVFFGSVTSQAKTMIDRFQGVWYARNLLGVEVFPERKKGAFICVAATDRKDFFDNARSIVKNFFATINAEYSQEVLASGLDEKEAVLGRPELLKQAFEMGESIGGSA